MDGWGLSDVELMAMFIYFVEFGWIYGLVLGWGVRDFSIESVAGVWEDCNDLLTSQEIVWFSGSSRPQLWFRLRNGANPAKLRRTAAQRPFLGTGFEKWLCSSTFEGNGGTGFALSACNQETGVSNKPCLGHRPPNDRPFFGHAGWFHNSGTVVCIKSVPCSQFITPNLFLPYSLTWYTIQRVGVGSATMRFLRTTSLITAFAMRGLSVAIPALGNSTDNACTPFNYEWTSRCWWRAVPIADAKTAIHNACQQLSSCIPGQQVPMTMPTQGYARDVTAQIRLGAQCGNAEIDWATNCEGYFETYVNDQCGEKGNETHFYQGGTCADVVCSGIREEQV
ncbi:uncharacterized protein BDR25DRAFT_347777 [Lindgomyces ingoldianus]|uniref:Uncharacterized protein n=1 Tax=Lindgomyces ingoldianus TaxID=673940 RepID=A0ACB6RE60_9PLEO|nr:uncharacterized protein BDR25DRAFT_347777 [Lindgomyces ingoldianus]KAF2477407.1 hypothetical protein BDR25DRAFT_347777 [Lindgomyces ingoldianus]